MNTKRKASQISELIGLTMQSVENIGDTELRFTSTDGRVFEFFHSQDCCESVSIEDINGDLKDLVGSPITLAEESVSDVNPPDASPEILAGYQDCFTWTFYRFATARGFVTVRWYGESNGYYSTSVSFDELPSNNRVIK